VQRVFVLPAEIGWSDIGSWSAVYNLLTRKPAANVSSGRIAEFDASGNFFWSPDKLVAAVGVHNLVLVDTPDAILVCHHSRTQDVGKIVKWIEEQKLRHLL
jgi:mannose-1-phosphate guanylyltransferase